MPFDPMKFAWAFLFFSLGMTRGMSMSAHNNHGYDTEPVLATAFCQRVMSGIITGPHFRKYFNSPGPLELGTMVAVLEIGAFGPSASLPHPRAHPHDGATF
jgi:hypothetical protein